MRSVTAADGGREQSGHRLQPARQPQVALLPQTRPAHEHFFGALCIAALPEFDLHINLNLGKGAAVMYAADLTEEYVDFNKGDVSDPASLGG